MAEDNFKHILTLGNSIIGVSILAMPYCFKQCGMLLGIVLLIVSSYINRLNCHFLVKSAISTKRRSYEFLAFHIFGPVGKLAIEVIQIGFLFGIAVSFFVIAGDLGPKILAQALDIPYSDRLRAVFLVGLCFLIVLPLCLLRNIDSLASMSAISLTFYILLVVKIVADSWRHIVSGAWQAEVVYWRPAGLLQALPIMSLALACQTNLFSIYENVPDPSLSRMNTVVAGAINLCCSVYILVGFFGYVALHDIDFGGNILVHLHPSPVSRWINVGFVMSIALGFPLIVYPCRTSVNSLLFRRPGASGLDTAQSYIPDLRFKCITFCILAMALCIGILIPSIEVVLGLLGSTMGTAIAILFPSVMFVKNTSRSSLEKMAAQIAFVLGILLLICGTYVNLYKADQLVAEKPLLVPPLTEAGGLLLPDPAANASRLREPAAAAGRVGPAVTVKPPDVHSSAEEPAAKPAAEEGARQEPAEPQPPVDGAAANKDGREGKPGEEADGEGNKEGRNDERSKLDKRKQSEDVEGNLADKGKDTEVRKGKETGGRKAEISGPGDLDEGALLKEKVEKSRDDALKPVENDADKLEKKQEQMLQKLEETQKEQKEMLKEQKQLLEEIKEQQKQQQAKASTPVNQPAIANKAIGSHAEAPNQSQQGNLYQQPIPNQQVGGNVPVAGNPPPAQHPAPALNAQPQGVNHQLNAANIQLQPVAVNIPPQQPAPAAGPPGGQQAPPPAGSQQLRGQLGSQQLVRPQSAPAPPHGLNYQQPLPMQHLSVQQQPGNVQQQPGNVQQQAGILQQQTGKIQQQGVNLQQQAGNIQQQMGNIQQQSGNVQQQVGNVQQQAVNVQQQGVNLQQQAGNVQQQVGNVEQQPGNLQQQAGNIQQQGGNLQQQPGNIQQQSGNVEQQPGNIQQQAGNIQQQPGNIQQQAGNIQQQAGNIQQQVGNVQQQVGNVQQQSGNVQQQGGNLQQQPGNIQQQAGNIQQQPGNIQQQAGNIQQQAGNIQQQVGNVQQQSGNVQQQAGNIQQQPGNLQQQAVNMQQDGRGGPLSPAVNPAAALQPAPNQQPILDQPPAGQTVVSSAGARGGPSRPVDRGGAAQPATAADAPPAQQRAPDAPPPAQGQVLYQPPRQQPAAAAQRAGLPDPATAQKWDSQVAGGRVRRAAVHEDEMLVDLADHWAAVEAAGAAGTSR